MGKHANASTASATATKHRKIQRQQDAQDRSKPRAKHARATHGRGLNLRREALTWLTTPDRSDVFCFENICETLGVDAARLRARVLAESDGELPQRSLH